MAEVDKDALITVGPTGLAKSFHADYVCDGVADQVEINQAIADANAAGGGIVRLLPGIYLTSDEVQILDNVYLRGSGSGATIIRAASGFFVGASAIVIAYAQSQWKVEGFTVDGTTNDVTVNGIVAQRTSPAAVCSDFAISRNAVKVKKAHNYAIWSAGGRHGLIDENQIDGGYTASDWAAIASGGTWASQNQEGIELYGSTDMLVLGNTVENIGSAGIHLPSNITDDAYLLRDVRIIGNKVSGSQHGILVPIVWVGDAANGNGGVDRLTIADNQVSEAHNSGIQVRIETGATPASRNIPFVRGIVIAQNTVAMAAASQNPYAAGLLLNNQPQDRTNPLFGRTKVIDNVVTGVANTQPFGRNWVVGWKGLDWNDNDLDCDVTASGFSHGTSIQATTEMSLCGNRIRSNARDVGLVFIECTQFVARGNTIVDWGTRGIGSPGVYAQGCTDFELSGTRLRSTTLTGITEFIKFIADCARFTHFHNVQVGTAYTGTITSDLSGVGIDPMTGGYKAVATDAAFTLTVAVDPRAIRHTGTLTANRAVTLSTTNASAGDKFQISRTGGGAFNLNVGTGPLKALATNTWCEVTYNGSAWYVSQYGTL